MRILSTCAFTAIVTGLLLSASPVLANGKLTEANMTQNDYDTIIATESSVPGEGPTYPPTPVHNLNKDQEKKLKEENGVRVIKGKDWRAMSPEERDRQLRELKKVQPAGTEYIIEVPSGNVWIIDATREAEIMERAGIRLWMGSEYDALPTARANAGDINNRDHGPRDIARAVEHQPL